MNLQTNLLFILLLLLSVVAQCIFGNFPFAFFAFPLDVLLALIWMGGMGYIYIKKSVPHVLSDYGFPRSVLTGPSVGF